MILSCREHSFSDIGIRFPHRPDFSALMCQLSDIAPIAHHRDLHHGYQREGVSTPQVLQECVEREGEVCSGDSWRCGYHGSRRPKERLLQEKRLSLLAVAWQVSQQHDS